ncbi:hypothetical protein RRG08_051072, partial [Elysia crispata]
SSKLSKRKDPSECDGTSSKGKGTYAVSFKPAYSLEYPCLRSVTEASLAHCNICNVEFKILHGGRHDCRKHVQSQKHVNRAKAANPSQQINNFSTSANSDLQNNITRAEALFTGVLVEHNLPLAAAGHASALFKKMFLVPITNPKDITEKYSCGRKKTATTIHELENSREKLIKHCRNAAYNIATDGNDVATKRYPLLITYTNEDCQVYVGLLAMLDLKDSGTGKNIAELIMNELKGLGILLENCLSLCTDKANVMIGSKTGLFGCLLQQCPQLYGTGCSCHRLHLAAEWAAKELQTNPDLSSRTSIITWTKVQTGCRIFKSSKNFLGLLSIRCLSMFQQDGCHLERWYSGPSTNGSPSHHLLPQNVKITRKSRPV